MPEQQPVGAEASELAQNGSGDIDRVLRRKSAAGIGAVPDGFSLLYGRGALEWIGMRWCSLLVLADSQEDYRRYCCIAYFDIGETGDLSL